MYVNWYNIGNIVKVNLSINKVVVIEIFFNVVYNNRFLYVNVVW